MNPPRRSTLLPALWISVPPHVRASLVLKEAQQFPSMFLFARSGCTFHQSLATCGGHILFPLVHQAQRIHDACKRDGSRAMLVIVEHRDAEPGAQALFHLEAAWRREVFQVDAAEGRSDRLHSRDDLVHVLGRQAVGASKPGRLSPARCLAIQRRPSAPR
jgi:hypothetical protein